MNRLLWLLSALALGACGGGGDGAANGSGGAAGAIDAAPVSGGTENPPPDAGVPDAAPPAPPPPRPTSNPAPVTEDCSAVTSVCLLPWPNSAFEQVDAEAETGVRVVLPASIGMPTVWARLSVQPADGFSPVGTIATWLPGGVELAALPISPEATTSADSPILLLDADATAETWGEALPWRAGVSPAAPGGGQVLFLSPLRALRPGGRYAVLIDRRLLGVDGAPLAPTVAMAERLGGTGDAPADAYFRDLLALTAHVGRTPADVAQLWDFHVRSAAGVRETLEALAAETRPFAAARPALLAENPQPGPHGATRYDLTIRIPLWRADRFAPINRGPDGRPVPVDTLDVETILVVPASATPEHPAIPMVFGHGLSASAELMYAQLVPDLDLESGPYALLLPDWDLHGVRGAGLQDILAIAGRLDGTAFAHSLLQSAADSLVFSDALGRLGPLPDRGAAIRPGAVYYLGQSLGSMIGAMGNAVDANVRAAVYNVGGGALSAVLREGGVVEKLGLKDAIHELVVTEPPAGLTDVQAVEVVMVMSQIAFDAGDPAALAAAGLRPGQAFILQESLGDGIVVNAATELLARTLGLPMAGPAVVTVPDIVAVDTPTLGEPAQALTQFKTSRDGFQAHLALSAEPLQAQAMHFFASFEDADPENDGDITYDCGGAACNLVDP